MSRLEQYIAELERRQTTGLAEFKADFPAQLVVERAFQAAIECCTDLASHAVSANRLGTPQEQRDLFQFLAAAGYLDPAFAATMGDMVGLRNRLVHLYMDVDLDRLHRYLLEDVPHLRRFRDFALQLIAAEESAGG